MVYYASKTLNEVQRNYITTEEELLVVIYALDKFQAYLVGSDIVIFTGQSALKYLLTKKDAKVRLIRWVLVLQEFNPQIKDKTGVENVVADHLSRLTIAHNTHSPPINDEFPEESLLLIESAPWYAHITNFLAIGGSQLNGRHKRRNTSSPKFIPIIGKSHFCSSTVWTRSFECVCLKKNNWEFSVTTMKMLVEVTLLHKRQL